MFFGYSFNYTGKQETINMEEYYGRLYKGNCDRRGGDLCFGSAGGICALSGLVVEPGGGLARRMGNTPRVYRVFFTVGHYTLTFRIN